MPTDRTGFFVQGVRFALRTAACARRGLARRGAVRVASSDWIVTVGRPMSGGPDAAFSGDATWLGVTWRADP
jgi:hypothetical protein